MIVYGHEFPDDTPKAAIELFCFRNHDPDCMLERHEHFINAIKALWPEVMPDGQAGFIWSDWAYRAAKSFVNREYQTWWGPAASGKTTMAGIFVLTYWLADPKNTTIMVCSTSRDMLERRIWREVVRYHSMLRDQIPGQIYSQPPRLVYEDEGGKNTISGIFGVAVTQGSTADAVSRLSGMHNRYNLLVIDEMQGTLQAAVETYDNTSTASLENKFLGMGNPMSRLDPLGRASEPVAGWHKISTELEEWKTKRGWCLYFDGLKSPGISDPKKFFFLLQQKDIDQMMKDPGPDSPRFWSQRRGFVPPEGLVETVLTESFIVKFKMASKPVWKHKTMIVAGLDPAFSNSGDACILAPVKVGAQVLVDENGISRIGPAALEILEPVRINLELSSGVPVSFYIAGRVKEALKELGIQPEHLAVDITGQQSALADIIDKTLNTQCVRVHASSTPSDKAISATDTRKAKEVYKDKVTEMWFRVREYGINHQVRSLPYEAQEQFIMRQLAKKAQMDKRLKLETKDDMKLRTGGRSPDLADAIALAFEVVYNVLDIKPGDVIDPDPADLVPGMLQDQQLHDRFTLPADANDLYSERNVESEIYFA